MLERCLGTRAYTKTMIHIGVNMPLGKCPWPLSILPSQGHLFYAATIVSDNRD
jgi:hypothetical protein